MERIIETEHVNRVFAVSSGEFCALKDINVSIPEGAFAILKGRSGSGKTTLMNIIGALDYPTSGKVRIAGNDITEMSETDRENMRRNMFGFVFQAVKCGIFSSHGRNQRESERTGGRVLETCRIGRQNEAYAG